MLWRCGLGDLKIYDVFKDKTDETVKNFWMHKGEVGKPVAAVSTADAYKIFGVSLLKDSTAAVHYYERNDQDVSVVSAICNQSIKSPLTVITALEVSANGQMVYLGGYSASDQKTKVPTMVVCEFNRGFGTLATHLFDDPSLKQPIVMQRFPSYEILAIGFYKNLMIVEYDESKKRISPLAKVPNLHSDFIVDIAIQGEKIFSKGIHEKFFKVTKFGERIDQSMLLNPEFGSTLNSVIAGQPLAETSRLPDNYPPDAIRYRQSVVSRIPVNSECVFEKIALSKTARAIYVGGAAGVEMLRLNDQTMQFYHTPVPVDCFNQALKQVRCFGMKSTAGGYFLAQEAGTNDLLIFTSKGDFKNKIKGAVPVPFGKFYLKKASLFSEIHISLEKLTKLFGSVDQPKSLLSTCKILK